MRYEALQKGEVWYKDDRLFDESTEDLYRDNTEIIYDINKDDERFD